MLRRHLDLDAVFSATDFQLDALGAGNATYRGRDTNDAASSLQEFDVMGAKVERSPAMRGAVRRKTNRTVVQPHEGHTWRGGTAWWFPERCTPASIA